MSNTEETKLTIYQTNLTEALLSDLAELVRQRPASMSPLQKDVILVSNPDVAQWLKINLTSINGVAANLEFPLPSAFMWQIFQALSADGLPDQSPYSKTRQVWRLMKLLPALSETPEFAWMKASLQPTAQSSECLRRFQLARRIADLFDQYLIYRPDWLNAWESEEDDDATAPEIHGLTQDQAWQPILWRCLVKDAAGEDAKVLHRGHLHREALSRLYQSEQLHLDGLPPRIFLFGFSSLPEQTLQLFNGLAKHIEVHWFQVNPCREYWLDIESEKTLARWALKSEHLQDLREDSYFTVGNPLLAAWGKMGRDYLSSMMDLLHGDLKEEYSDYPTTGALSALQQEINNLTNRGQFDALTPQQLDSNQDKLLLTDKQLDNLRFHSCHSPAREVEILKDQLLSLFNGDSELEPNDVLVMMPDVAGYAPHIHAVFGASSGNQRFSYSLNDLNSVQESPLLQSVMDMMQLADSRFLLSEVLGLLEVPATMRRFNINDNELAKIGRWLADVGVRWGRDSTHRQTLGLGDFEQNSWAFGLKRMLTGYAMHPDQGLLDQAVLPFDEIEGSDGVVLGKLLSFVDQLEHYCREIDTPRSATQWSEFMTEMCDAMYMADSAETLLLNKVFKLVTELGNDCGEVAYTEQIDRATFSSYLKQGLERPSANKRFKVGVVNFCSLMPMRALPFKVICLLGMNDGDFPGYSRADTFDLMGGNRRPGDRSRQLDDRYLFLEALLSARQHIHISWVGRDIRDNSERPPAVPVAELREYIADAWCRDKDTDLPAKDAASNILQVMTRQHPLQPYHPQYFTGPEPQRSFDKRWQQNLMANQAVMPFDDEKLKSDIELAGSVIELKHFIAMFLNPCKEFMQRRLGVYFDEEDKRLDHENFELNGLEKWQLKAGFFALQRRQQDVGHYRESVLHSGLLPAGEAGISALQDAAEANNVLLEKGRDLVPPRAEFDTVRIALDGGRVTLAGTLPKAHSGYRTVIKVGSMKGKDKLRSWLLHLAASAAYDDKQRESWNGTTLLLSSDRAMQFHPMIQEVAITQLQKYLRLYEQALCRPLPFFVECGSALQQEVEKAGEEDINGSDLYERIKEKWSSEYSRSSNATPGEGEDLYIQRCYPDLKEVMDSLLDTSRDIIKPMLSYSDKDKTLNQFFKQLGS